MKENTAKSTRAFGRSAALLAAIGIVSKLIGALYRVPLTNIVGAEGMGLYQMVFPLYTILLAFCGGGMTSAVSRTVAKYTALNKPATALRVLKVAIVPLAAVSVVACGGVALLSNVISSLQGNSDAAVAYLALCPSLLFACGINVFRGYFQGKAQMLPSGISQLIEQSVKLVLGLYLGRLLLPYGVKYAVAGALIGVSASELLALLYLSVRFVVDRRKHGKARYVRIAVPAFDTEAASELAPVYAETVTDRALVKELFAFALPVTLGALVLPATQMIDSVLVINLLMYGGAARGDATALFGLFVGPVGTLINMPTVVALSVAVAFLPTITSAVERKQSAAPATRHALKYIMLFVIPVTVAFLFFPDSVCGVLYRRGLTASEQAMAARLLRVQALSVFYIGVLQLATAVLQGYDRAHKPVINLVIGACVKVGLTPLLVRAFGIIGAATATAACYAVAATLTARCAYKCGAIGGSIADAFVKPLVSSLVAAAAFACTVMLLKNTSLSFLWTTVIGGAAFVFVYGAGVLISGAFGLQPLLAIARNRKKSGKSDNA